MKTFFAAIALWLGIIDSSMAQADLTPISIINGDGVSITVQAELATNREDRQRGLMYREELPPLQGMLLTYPHPTTVRMWMKNTPISLDMIFIDKDGHVSKIVKDTAPLSRKVIGPYQKIQAVLEVPAGTCNQYNIDETAVVILPEGI